MENCLGAAPVQLASVCLKTAEVQEKQLPSPVSSGSSALDNEVLDGGFHYGEITSVAGAKGSGKSFVGFSHIQHF